MPELPEVETIRRGLAIALVGRRFVRILQTRPDLRFPIPGGLAQRLRDHRVEAVERRGKYLLVHVDGGLVLLGHLGMSGRLLVMPAGAMVPGPHDHLVFETDDGQAVVFHDPRRFGMIDLVGPGELADHPRLAGLGPEPLGATFTAEHLDRALAGRRSPIKSVLLDQSVVAGLGNIYVCEALFHARISPLRNAATVAGTRAARLVPAIRQVLTEAIDAGGSSLRDYVHVSGELGFFQDRFAVYGRTGAACPGCTCDLPKTGGIARVIQSNRSSFYCPHRQR